MIAAIKLKDGHVAKFKSSVSSWKVLSRPEKYVALIVQRFKHQFGCFFFFFFWFAVNENILERNSAWHRDNSGGWVCLPKSEVYIFELCLLKKIFKPNWRQYSGCGYSEETCTSVQNCQCRSSTLWCCRKLFFFQDKKKTRGEYGITEQAILRLDCVQ